MIQWVLVISLGPVQGFIAAARKTRDLWYGSYLLSALARATAEAVQEQGGELVFPAAAALTANDAVANKVVAVVSTDPAAIAAAAAAAARARLDQESTTMRAVLADRKAERAIDLDLLQQQLAGLMEIAAAWWPIIEHDYADARSHADALLAGRKALRDFAPLPSRNGLPKSSLDGSRDTVLRPRQSAEVRARLGLKEHEHLDGISLLKRLALPQRFVSVSRVAVDPLVRAGVGSATLASLRDCAEELVHTSDLAQKLPDTMSQYADFPYDTDLWDVDGDVDLSLASNHARAAVATFHGLVRALKKEIRCSTVPAYLAVLKADGDRMGKLVSEITTPEKHQELSAALATFARQAGRLVAEQHGALVYSGGDDVLAFLPADSAIACAAALASAFRQALAPLGLSTQPTLSVGVAFGHQMEDLADLLAYADAAEKAAKGPRNALAVAFHTRSGGTAVTHVRQWADDTALVAQDWEKWLGWIVSGALSHGTPYELRSLIAELKPLKAAPSVAAMLPKEVQRVLGRKKQKDGGKLSAELIQEFLTPPQAGSLLDHVSCMVDGLLIAGNVAPIWQLTQPTRKDGQL